MATIENRGDAVRVSWRLGGSREGARQSVTFRGKPAGRLKLAQAAKLLVESHGHNMTRDECRRAIHGTAEPEPSVPLFKDWVSAWIEDRARMRDIQPDVVVYYRRMLESRANPYLGYLRLDEITPEVMRGWVAWLSSSRITIGSKNRRTGDRLLSPTTIRRAHAIVHTCLSAAVPKWLMVNPAARPAGASKHTSGLPKRVTFEGMFLRPDEVNLILEHCDPHIRDLVFIAARSGLRLGELIALEARYVVFDRDGDATILVRQARKNDSTVGPPKSAASHREVTVDREASRILVQRTRGKRPKALVFPSPKGGMWDENNLRDRYWYRSVAAASRCPEHPPPAPPKPTRGPARQLRHDEVSTCDCPTRLRRRPRIHDLRHTHASLLIAEGWHVSKIQRRLGHASYHTTTSTYSHLMDLGNREELAGLEARLKHRVLVEPPTAPRPRAGSALRRARRGGVRRLHVRRRGS